MASLRLKVMRGSDLTPALLQSMSELRRGIMTMKPHINLAADFDKFAALCRTSEHTFLFYDADQQLAGMYLLVLRRGRTEAGKRYLLVFSEYAFMRKQYRANPALPRSVLLLLWLLLRQWRGESVWLSGIAYPTGHLLLEKFFGGLVLQGEANLSPMQTTLLDRITAEFAGASWDAVAGHVAMPTVPPRMSPMWQANVKNDPFYLRYMALCPHWQEGFGLPGVTQLRPLAVIGRVLGKIAQRMARPLSSRRQP